MQRITTHVPVRLRRRMPNVKLKELRINAGLSPNELGRRIGVSGKTIRDAEAGTTPRPRIQFAIAEQFGKQPLDIWPLEVQEGVAR